MSSQVEKARHLYKELRDFQKVADLTGVARSTVVRWCDDLKKDFPTLSDQYQKEKIEQVIRLRNEARDDPDFNLDRYAQREGIEASVLSKALRGVTFKYLNATTPPVKQIMNKPEKKEEARLLYQGGMGSNQIARKLAVSKSSVSFWCADLIHAKTEKLRSEGIIRKASKPNPNRKKGKGKYKSLTIQDAVDIRRAIRAEGYMRLRERAEHYGVNITCISYAARGMTHAAANKIEPPIEERLPLPPRPSNPKKRQGLDENLIQEAIALLKSDPNHWTFSALAAWMSDKTGRDYRPTHMARAIRNRDPNLVQLIEAKHVPKVRTDEDRRRDRIKAAAKRMELKKLIAEEEAYERWVAAGSPTS